MSQWKFSFRVSRIVPVCATVLFLWGALVWYGGDWVAKERVQKLTTNEGEILAERADALAYNLHRYLAFLHALPTHIAADSAVIKALLAHRDGSEKLPSDVRAKTARWMANSELSSLSQELKRENGQFETDITWVINNIGDCIASSNSDTPENFVGTNYRDRDYFVMTTKGRLGHQFAVGRKTGVPGIYFSSPVMDGTVFLGSVVIKVNVDKIAPLIGSADSLVTDEYGVVVISRRPALYLRAMPNQRLEELSPEARDLRYRRRNLEPLEIEPWEHWSGMFHFDKREAPYLIATRSEIAEGLSVHVMDELVEVEKIYRDILIFKFSAITAGSALTLFIAGIFLHLRRSARHVNELKAKQAAIVSAMERLEDAQSIGHFGYWNCDIQADLVSGSNEARMILDISDTDSLCFKEFFQSVHCDDKDLLLSTWIDSISYRLAYDVECRFLVNRRIRWVRLVAEIRRNNSGGATSAIGTIQDITERTETLKKLERREAIYRSIVNQARDSIILIDIETKRIVEANHAAATNLGYTQEEFLQLTIPDFAKGEPPDVIKSRLERIIQGNEPTFETKHWAKDGSEQDVRVSARSISIDGQTYIAAI